MTLFRHAFVRNMIRATFLSVVLVGILTAGSLLHAASLQEQMTALGLTAIPHDLTAPTFRLPDLEGQMVSLQDYRSQVVMLYFWTTW